MVIPAIAALTAANYEGKDRALAYALIGGITAVAVAAGPLIGGWVTTNSSWRYVFAGETVVVTGIILVRGQIAQAPKAEHRPKLDVVGSALSVGRPGTGRVRDPDEQQVGLRQAARGADDQRQRDHPARLLGGALHGPGRARDTRRIRPLGGAPAPPGPRPPARHSPAEDHAASRRALDAAWPAAGPDGDSSSSSPSTCRSWSGSTRSRPASGCFPCRWRCWSPRWPVRRSRGGARRGRSRRRASS